MAGNGPLDMGKWKGLFEWSMRYQDGAQQTAGDGVRELDPERRAWLEQAMQEFMKDFAERMREIKDALTGSASQQQGGTTDEGAGGSQLQGGTGATTALSLAEKEALCDELLDIVESVDHARDLHTIGGLPTLLELMSSPHASLRWRAAEIAATCMANHPPVQRWFMEGGALPPLLALLGDVDARVRTKALLGVSALVRHYDPALAAFRGAGGLPRLLALLGAAPAAARVAEAVLEGGAEQHKQQQQQQQEKQEEQPQEDVCATRKMQRKALALLHYVLLKEPGDAVEAAALGAVPALARLLDAPGTDSDARQAVLAVLAELAANPSAWPALGGESGRLAERLTALEVQHAALPAADMDAEAEEGVLLRRLLGALSAPPRLRVCGGLQDHVELDPHQDSGAGGNKTLSLREEGGASGGSPGAAAGGDGSGAPLPPSGGALMVVPQPELR